MEGDRDLCEENGGKTPKFGVFNLKPELTIVGVNSGKKQRKKINFK
jgi:hypothetical protein